MANTTQARRQGGFTLVEAMIALTVAAILLTWAAPALNDFITRNRMSTEVNYFTASLHFARSEAVKRLQNVGLCPSTNGTACNAGSNWHQGWAVYADDDGTAGFSAGDTVLQLNPALPSDFQVDAGRNVIVFQPDGQSAGNNDTFTFCDNGGVAESRQIILSNQGRVRSQRMGGAGSC